MSFPSVTSFMQCKYDGGARPGKPTFGVLHDAETPLQAGYAASIASYFTRNTNETSAHFMVDPVATVQMLDTNRIGWHVGNGNPRSIGIEQAGYARFAVADWTTADGLKQMQRVANLMRDIKATHGIGLYWMSDQQIRDAHAGRIVGGWTTHEQCARVLGGSGHTDPMPAYPLAKLMALANGSAPTPVPEADMPLTVDDLKAIREYVWRSNHPDGMVPRDVLLDVQAALRDPIHSTVPGSNVSLNPRDMLASVDNNAWTTAQAQAALAASLNAITAAVKAGGGGAGFTLEQAVAAGRTGAEQALAELAQRLVP